MSKNSKDIVFVAAQRSAIGKYKGIYKDLQAHDLGSLVIKSLIQKTKLKEDMIDDALDSFRLSQLENEGNDPTESGMSYGTPHDLASLYGNKRDKAVGPAQVPTGYDEKDPGRPTEKPQNYGSDKGNFSRDPIGKGGLEAPSPEKPSDGNKVSTFEAASLKKSLQKLKNKKQVLKEENEGGLLSEKNIKSQK